MRLARILVEKGFPVLRRTVERSDGRMMLFPSKAFAAPDEFLVEYLATGEVLAVARAGVDADGVAVVVLERRAA